jgi:hypothetical protein
VGVHEQPVLEGLHVVVGSPRRLLALADAAQLVSGIERDDCGRSCPPDPLEGASPEQVRNPSSTKPASGSGEVMRSRTIATTRSSGTSSPRSIELRAASPSVVPSATWWRSMSPVEM